jgi:calcyclin binding protein
MTTYEKKANEPRVPKLDNDDPSAGLMDMMKQMYEDGDDDMKRTIAKAWTESREKQMNF